MPACVETCLVGALEFGDPNDLLREETRRLARQVSLGLRQADEARKEPPVVALWRGLEQRQAAVGP